MHPYIYIGDQSIFLYDFFNNLSVVVLLISSLIRIKAKKEALTYPSLVIINTISNKSEIRVRKMTTVLAVIEIVIMCLMVVLSLDNLNDKFGDLVGTGVNYFGTLYVISIIFYVFNFLIRTNPLKQMDFVTISLPLTMVVTKVACFFGGCCYGIPLLSGMYNEVVEEYQFPVQLIECGEALLIFLFLSIYKKKAKTGTMFPIYMILYCTTRFFSEFLRHEENVFGILKTYHILCIIGLIFGIVQLIVILKFGDRIKAYYDKKAQKLTTKVEEEEITA